MDLSGPRFSLSTSAPFILFDNKNAAYLSKKPSNLPPPQSNPPPRPWWPRNAKNGTVKKVIWKKCWKSHLWAQKLRPKNHVNHQFKPIWTWCKTWRKISTIFGNPTSIDDQGKGQNLRPSLSRLWRFPASDPKTIPRWYFGGSWSDWWGVWQAGNTSETNGVVCEIKAGSGKALPLSIAGSWRGRGIPIAFTPGRVTFHSQHTSESFFFKSSQPLPCRGKWSISPGGGVVVGMRKYMGDEGKNKIDIVQKTVRGQIQKEIDFYEESEAAKNCQAHFTYQSHVNWHLAQRQNMLLGPIFLCFEPIPFGEVCALLPWTPALNDNVRHLGECNLMTPSWIVDIQNTAKNQAECQWVDSTFASALTAAPVHMFRSMLIHYPQPLNGSNEKKLGGALYNFPYSTTNLGLIWLKVWDSGSPYFGNPLLELGSDHDWKKDLGSNVREAKLAHEKFR